MLRLEALRDATVAGRVFTHDPALVALAQREQHNDHVVYARTRAWLAARGIVDED